MTATPTKNPLKIASGLLQRYPVLYLIALVGMVRMFFWMLDQRAVAGGWWFPAIIFLLFILVGNAVVIFYWLLCGRR